MGEKATDLDDEVCLCTNVVGLLTWSGSQTKQEDTPKASSSRRPRGSKLGKTSLASFENPDIRRLAKLGHRQLRQHVVTVEAFPFPIDKDELCWRLVQEAITKEPRLQQVLDKVENDQCTKERLLDYVSAFTITDNLANCYTRFGGQLRRSEESL